MATWSFTKVKRLFGALAPITVKDLLSLEPVIFWYDWSLEEMPIYVFESLFLDLILW